MISSGSTPKLLLSAEHSRALDSEAQTEWGFDVCSLIEAAGRACTQTLQKAFPDCFANRPRITVIAGTGNNAADAMVMLRYWLLSGLTEASTSALVVSRIPKTGEKEPWAELYRSLEKMNVPILAWEETSETFIKTVKAILSQSDIIVDGIAGTGIKGPLRGMPLQMVETLNSLEKNSPLPSRPFIVSVDIPSGNSDEWEAGMPIVDADMTLAIEPQKHCIYAPAARPYAGTILPVGGIFPGELIAKYKGAELLDWDCARERISKIRPDAYKNKRGTVEVRAGSPGFTGAALIAARGAQAAGAGLIRIVADADIYPILASRVSGIMVASAEDTVLRVPPDAVILGPGWGKETDRTQVLEKALAMEKDGLPLILDADAIELVRGKVFNGSAILTPHPGELGKYTGIDQKELLNCHAPVLLGLALKCNAVILLKGHVITVAAPDGRLGVLDGMLPGLAAGGSGDLLAGFCAAIAARMNRENNFDAFNCACAAAALLIASGRSEGLVNRFTDPLELADRAADIAGSAWLGG